MTAAIVKPERLTIVDEGESLVLRGEGDAVIASSVWVASLLAPPQLMPPPTPTEGGFELRVADLPDDVLRLHADTVAGIVVADLVRLGAAADFAPTSCAHEVTRTRYLDVGPLAAGTTVDRTIDLVNRCPDTDVELIGARTLDGSRARILGTFPLRLAPQQRAELTLQVDAATPDADLAFVALDLADGEPPVVITVRATTP